MTSPEEEQKLIQGLSQGDPGSYDRLVDLYGKKIFRLALQLSGERFDAEDIVQEVFFNVLRHIQSFRSDSGIQTWLYRITVNEFLKSKRGKLKQSMQSMPIDQIPDTENLHDPKPDIEVNTEMVNSRIKAALTQLSENQRSVFILRHFHDLSIREVAEVTEMQPGTVKTHMHRAVQRLQVLLKPYNIES